jgi:hypothetical protein
MIIRNYLNKDKSKFPKFYITSTLIFAFVVIFSQQVNIASALTGINQQIPYSGSIVNNAGVVLPDNTYRAKFVLWNALTGGTSVYEEIRDGITTYSGTVSPALSINDGRFDILLGSQNTALPSISNNDTLYLEIQLDMDSNGSYEEVFNPRRRIGSALSAINSLRLVAANGGTDTDTLSLDIAGNVVATSLGGTVNASTPGGYDRVIIGNSSGQFSQVNISALSGSSGWALAGNSTTDAWNGTSGTRLGTTSAQPLVLATTNATAQDIRFFTGANGANERMRITSGGNVGIGTTDPGALGAVGSARLRVRGNGSTAVDVGVLDITKSNNQSIMFVAENGNIAIGGDTTPGGRLLVASEVGLATSYAMLINSGLNATEGNLYYGNSGNLSLGANSAQDSTRLLVKASSRVGAIAALDVTNASGTSMLYVQNDGNVGIGTTSPTALLQVGTGSAIPGSTGLFVNGGRSIRIGATDGDGNYGGYITGTWPNSTSTLTLGTRSAGTDKALMTLQNNGNVGIGTTAPTARLNLPAGTATANTAPLKFTAGTNLTTAEAGALEWNGTNLFLTNSGNTRQTINQGLTATATLDFPGTSNDIHRDLAITVTGASPGDVVSLGIPNESVPTLACNFIAWVSAANTVTVRFSNHSGGTVDPGIGTFKVFVTK